MSRLKLNLILGAAVAVPLLSSPAQAASFNCDRAATKMEQLICSDAALSRTDENLAAAYERALKAASDPEPIRKLQREWLADTAKHCDSVACLKNAYAQRIMQLDSFSARQERQANKAR
ncbi:MAG TPA: lysozyme inhibitor LprI family protein [Gallionellaceae bacterium]